MKEQLTGKTPARSGTDWAHIRDLTDKDTRSATDADPEVRPTERSLSQQFRHPN